jgi:hypothetical protein
MTGISDGTGTCPICGRESVSCWPKSKLKGSIHSTNYECPDCGNFDITPEAETDYSLQNPLTKKELLILIKNENELERGRSLPITSKILKQCWLKTKSS